MNRVAFHTQLASIMEVLANAAVAEICKLVDDGYAVLRFEMSQTQKENRALKRKIQMMEPKTVREFADASRDNFADCVPVRDNLGKQEAEGIVQNEGMMFSRHLVTHQLRKHGDTDNVPLQATMVDQLTETEDEPEAESLLIKEERGDEDMESTSLCGKFDSGEDCIKSRAVNGDRHPVVDSASPKAMKGTEEFSEQHRTRPCVSEVSGLESVLKTEPERATGSKSLQHIGSDHSSNSTGRLNSPYAEYSAYSTHNQLRTSFAQGLVETETDHPTCSYTTEMDSESFSFHSELQPVPSSEEGGAERVHLESPGVKPELVMIDSVSDELEPDMRSAWDHETISSVEYTPRSRNRGEGWRGRKQRESAFGMCAPQIQMTVNDSTAKSDAIGVNGYIPCDPNFITPKDIKTHNRVGKREKLFICTICGKAFNRPKKVEIHLRVHTGEKPFSCTLCGKWFAESGNLKKHQRVHTGEKPYSCTHCGRRFAWIRNLKTHQQRNHV